MTTATEVKKSLTVLSATQLETFDLCNRKWWLAWAQKLGLQIAGSQVFGTVLHGVAERYLSTDILGRDAEGRTVELFPRGWETAYSRFDATKIEGSLKPVEQDLAKRLIEAAISEGILERRPGRQIEKNFRKSVIVTDEDNVEIMGFIDVCGRDHVEDHKTASSLRYAKNEKTLKSTLQMLIYAKVVLDEARDRREPVPPEITVIHNYYVKDEKKPHVRRVKATLTPAEIDTAWEGIKERASKMVMLKRKAVNWSDIPDPPNKERACNAYRGCEFRGICNGRETVDFYRNRLASEKATEYPVVSSGGGVSQLTDTTKGTAEMAENIFQTKLAAKKALNGAASAGLAVGTKPVVSINPPAAPVAAPVAVAPVAAAAPAPSVALPVVQPEGAPPWANPACRACGGHGFVKTGDPCRICQAWAKVNGKPLPTPENVMIESPGDGSVVWAMLDGSAQGVYTPPGGVQPVAVSVKEAASVAAPVAPEPPATVAQAAAQAQIVTTDPDGDDAENPPVASKGGRPRKGFILVTRAAVAYGEGRPGSGREVFLLHKVLEDLGRKMAEASGVESFYDLDAFKRRDMLSKHGASIAETFGTGIVVALDVGTAMSDLKALHEAIRPYAGLEIIGA